MTKQLFALLLTTVAFPGLVQAAEEINCTASPECATLGYTQTECPKGGIRCPFDKTKMFCVSGFGGEDFSFKNTIYQYQIVFADGSTGTYYDDTKDPIGIITYVHPNGQGNHGLIMSLDQPTVQTRAFALHYCANYTTKGTKVGDWHLADIGEIGTMQNGDEIDNTTQLNTLNNILKTIPGAQALGVSFSYYYSRKCSHKDAYLWVDCDVSSLGCPPNSYDYFNNYSYRYPSEYLNIGGAAKNWYGQVATSNCTTSGYSDEIQRYCTDYNPAPGCVNTDTSTYNGYYIFGGNTFYYSSSYWSASDNPSGTTPYVVDLYQNNQTTTSSAQRGHFRCVAYL